MDGLTRARRLAVFVGTRRAFAMAVRQQDVSNRQTALKELLLGGAAEDGEQIISSYIANRFKNISR